MTATMSFCCAHASTRSQEIVSAAYDFHRPAEGLDSREIEREQRTTLEIENTLVERKTSVSRRRLLREVMGVAVNTLTRSKFGTIAEHKRNPTSGAGYIDN